MPANATVTAADNVDTQALSVVGFIDDQGWPLSEVEEVRLSVGNDASYAIITIPNQAIDDTVPVIAAIDGGLVDGIKAGAPVIVLAQGTDVSTVLFVGSVVDIDQEYSASLDRAAVLAVDHRYLLSGIPIIGSFWMDGTSDSGFTFRQGWHLHINPNGQPNCIFRDALGSKIPVMCNANYGVTDATNPAKDSEQSTTVACYWTNRSLLKYWEAAFQVLATSVARLAMPSYPVLPDTIIWPVGFESGIEFEETAEDDRKAEEFDYDGLTLLAGLNRAISAAGPFALYMVPDSTDESPTNIMSISLTRYDGGGVNMNRPALGNAQTVLDQPKIILGASLKESGKNTYTRFAASGELVFIERRINTKDDNTGTLLRAWDTATDTAFLEYIQTRVDDGDTLIIARQKADREFTSFGHAYQLDPTFDFQAGTGESAETIAEVGRPILPELLTSYLEEEAETNTLDKLRFRRPIVVEFQEEGDDPDSDPWLLADFNTGMIVDADGTIWFPGLRERGLTYTAVESGGVVTVTNRKLRFTVAIPADHRITAERKLAIDETALVEQIAGTAANENRIAKGFERMYYANSAGHYAKEERVDSWPIPETVTGTAQPDDKPGLADDDFLRNDQVNLENHVERRARDLGRLEKSGELIFGRIVPSMKPGIKIATLEGSGSPYSIKGVTTSILFSTRRTDRERKDSDDLGQFTKVIMT